jgi:hypothetical protein
MFPRDLLVKAPVRAMPGFNRSPNGTTIASADCGNGCDEIVVHRIFAAASQRHPRTMGEFAHVAQPYLKAGYHREVAEAHRRYFGGSSQT